VTEILYRTTAHGRHWYSETRVRPAAVRKEIAGPSLYWTRPGPECVENMLRARNALRAAGFNVEQFIEGEWQDITDKFWPEAPAGEWVAWIARSQSET
jgi:hypothetical protein